MVGAQLQQHKHNTKNGTWSSNHGTSSTKSTIITTAAQQQAGLGSAAAALATGDMQALGQVAQSQGVRTITDVTFQQALQ